MSPIAPWKSRQSPVTGALVLSVWSVLAGAAVAPAGDPVRVSAILAEPEAYHLRTLQLHGTVRAPRPLEPYPVLGRLCRAVFYLLEDGSGGIDLLVLGPCGDPSADDAPLPDGARVRVEARIEAPGRYTGEGLPPGGIVRTRVRAVAVSLAREKE